METLRSRHGSSSFPRFDRHKAFVDTGLGAAGQSSAGVAPTLNGFKELCRRESPSCSNRANLLVISIRPHLRTHRTYESRTSDLWPNCALSGPRNLCRSYPRLCAQPHRQSPQAALRGRCGEILHAAEATHRFAHANKWHFINIPFDGHQHSLNDVQSFCGANLCAPERIQHYKDTLSVNATVAVQAEALVFLAHLVGDLHQPLHSVVRNNDAGGNSVIVQIFKGEFTLHHVWDDEIIIRMQNTQGVALGTEALRSHHLSAILPDSGPFNPWSGDGMPSRKLSPSAT